MQVSMQIRLTTEAAVHTKQNNCGNFGTVLFQYVKRLLSVILLKQVLTTAVFVKIFQNFQKIHFLYNTSGLLVPTPVLPAQLVCEVGSIYVKNSLSA